MGAINTRVNVTCSSKGGRKGVQRDAQSKGLVRGRYKSKSCLTYTGWQGLIPSSPLPRQADQRPAASQGVARVTAEGHRAAGEVALIVDLIAELRDAGVLAFNEFKTWSGRKQHLFSSAT